MPGHGGGLDAPKTAQMTGRRLPIGIRTFRKMRERDCYYVDKTAYIERLLRKGTHYFLSKTVRLSVAAALALVLIAAVGSVAHAQVESCDVPDRITVAGFEIEAVSDTVPLDQIDFPTTLRWTAALLLPSLAKDEVGIYLYDPQSFPESGISVRNRHVVWFIVCNQGESFWARLGRIRQPLPGNDSASAYSFQRDGASTYGADRLYLGTTIPVPRSSSGLTASEIMRGDLSAFPQIPGTQAP